MAKSLIILAIFLQCILGMQLLQPVAQDKHYDYTIIYPAFLTDLLKQNSPKVLAQKMFEEFCGQDNSLDQEKFKGLLEKYGGEKILSDPGITTLIFNEASNNDGYISKLDL